MITIQKLRADRTFDVDVLRTVKNGKAFYFIKRENDSKFIRISKAVYLELDSLFQCSFNLLTKIDKETVKHFKSMSLI
ncbi:hypothetical protein V6C59_17485 [Acinetobacter bereziniae]|uniref:hypothetical protein n=1 Tax=Acinetobacter bereziniae TaxID=106648 RepID=UPI002FD9197F